MSVRAARAAGELTPPRVRLPNHFWVGVQYDTFVEHWLREQAAGLASQWAAKLRDAGTAHEGALSLP